MPVAMYVANMSWIIFLVFEVWILTLLEEMGVERQKSGRVR